MSGQTTDLAAWPSTTDGADRLFAALESASRREALAELSRRDDPAEITDLAASLAESTDRPDDADEVAVRLWHVDLPKLADLGLVTVDYETRVAELTLDGQRAAAVTARPGNDQ
jgi:DNA-binding transcriptional ArsR family regulator